MKRHHVEFTINGNSTTLDVEARTTLADALRGDLDLTGTHLGCEHGVCGACTIIVDGAPARSCLMLAVQAEGADIRTIEGLSPPSGLSDIQQALRDHHGLQCGFCTPGMVVMLHHLLSTNAAPTEEDIREALSGQLCRCTGYQGVLAAARVVIAARKVNNDTPAIP